MFLDKVHIKFKLGTIENVTCSHGWFGLNIKQDEDMSIQIDENDKVEEITEPQISISRCK